jgi:hypothetical protein
LGIITPEQIDILYEILRKHIPDDFNWEEQYHNRWIFLTLTSFASTLKDKIKTDVTQIMPPLLTFPIFEKQRKAIDAIMKPPKESDIFFIAGAYDEVFFNFQLDYPTSKLAEKAMQKGSEVTKNLTAYLANVSNEILEDKVVKSLNTERKVCYLLQRLMYLLDVKYFELEKMRCLLFISKLFPYKSVTSLMYANPK